MARPKPEEPWVQLTVRVPDSVASKLAAQAEACSLSPAGLARGYVAKMVDFAERPSVLSPEMAALAARSVVNPVSQLPVPETTRERITSDELREDAL